MFKFRIFINFESRFLSSTALNIVKRKTSTKIKKFFTQSKVPKNKRSQKIINYIKARRKKSLIFMYYMSIVSGREKIENEAPRCWINGTKNCCLLSSKLRWDTKNKIVPLLVWIDLNEIDGVSETLGKCFWVIHEQVEFSKLIF